ncbi:MAG: two-component system sensor histidine kinase BarA [Polaribacter sp.]|jgi:two-component system sensor histidine kinase BarA
MNQWGIKARVILLAVVPTGLVALVMGSYFVTTRIQDLNNNLQVRGLTVAKYVSQISEFAVLSANHQTLSKLVSSARDGDQDILAIAIYNKQNILLASSGTSELVLILSGTKESQLTQTEIQKLENGLLVRTPIYSQQNLKQRVPLSNKTQSYTALSPIGYVAVYFTHQNISLRKYQTIITAIIILFLGLVLGAMLAQNMAKNITTPIILLATAVKRIKEGQLKVQIQSSTSGELKTLVNGFNSMSDSLFEAREEMQVAIEQATADINSTNTALEEQNVELNWARKEAIESSRVKSEFLANMTHEIRTPMNGVIGFTNLLLKSQLNTKQKRQLETISNSSNGLLKIIDDILDFSKIEAGKMNVEQRPINLMNCIDETLSLLAPSAQSKNLEIIGIVYQDVPKNLLGDAGHILQILTNLCNNAIKFTEKGTVQIRVMLEDDTDNRVRLKFNITDTGIGLSKEQQNILFQAFTQADTTTTRRFGGTGLGLVISKKLIESMNGKIGLDSQEGVGSTFWFTIELVKDLDAEDVNFLTFPGRKILFHDSNNLSQLATKYLLNQLGTQIETANEIEILSDIALKNKTLDKDIHLIIVGGYPSNSPQLLNLKKKAEELEVLLVVLINSSDEHIIRDHVKAGYDKLISKPLSLNSLYESLSNWFIADESNNDIIIKPMGQKLTRKNLKILCVDDNDSNLRLIQAFMDDFDLEADFVNSGLKAVQNTSVNNYDLIFMDIQMPIMDGISATKQIRQINRHNSKTPIIALTAHAIKGEKERIIQSGMDDFLTKPIAQDDLRKNIQKWTNSPVSYKSKLTLNKKINNEQNSDLDNTSIDLSIDWELSLKNSNQKQDLAKQMLKMLIHSFIEVEDNIILHSKIKNLNKLTSEVHKLHGATAYCGVPVLKTLAYEYETELKQKGMTDNSEHIKNLLFAEMRNVEIFSKKYLP